MAQPAEQIRIFIEFVLALLILVVSMPIILIALVLVRATSRGPVIYSQKRLGRGGRVFTIYKIRTMYRDSEPNGARWSVPGDPRITPVGRLLRWSHVDELPQLINILQGKMSLVGPRPERPEIVGQLERVIPDYRRRLNVRPGVTGLAQVLQPPDTNLGMVSSKLSLDLHYIDHATSGSISGFSWPPCRMFSASRRRRSHGFSGFPGYRVRGRRNRPRRRRRVS